MTTRKSTPPAPLRKPATLDHLRKKPLFTQYMAFLTEHFQEPKEPPASATPEERAAYLKARAEWQAAVEDATVEVKLQALSRRRFRELKDEHPATEEQIQRAKAKGEGIPEYNEETFAPALIAKSIVEPAGLTPEDAQAIWEEWEEGDARLLFAGCLACNTYMRLEFYQKKSVPTGG